MVYFSVIDFWPFVPTYLSYSITPVFKDLKAASYTPNFVFLLLTRYHHIKYKRYVLFTHPHIAWKTYKG